MALRPPLAAVAKQWVIENLLEVQSGMVGSWRRCR
jgi:hypothetical protein